MSTFYVLLSVVLMLQASRACDGNNEEEQLAAARQQSDEYFANAYGFNPNPWSSAYYQPSARVPGYASLYEGRNPLGRQPSNYNPVKKYFANNNNNNADGENNQQPEGRFAFGGLGLNLINSGLFNNRFTPASSWRPFANLANRIPVSVNPDFSGPIANFDACTSPSGDAGICVPGSVCSIFGGRPSGSCILGKVCCINAITTCGGTVTLNNTYWQSPSTAVSAPSTCALTLRMDTKLVEQLAKPICQVRLDFVSFTIGGPSTAAPTAGTCTDTFTVGGSTNVAPTICGVNSGQHMYLDVPSSASNPTDVQLMFNFATGTTSIRSWNIKIAMLQCGASHLAPTDCLQYFTSTAGRVKSFNWQDSTTAQQLNSQNYNICFRTELVSGSKASQMCLSICTGISTTSNAFYITSVPSLPEGGPAVAATGADYLNSASGFSISDGKSFPAVLTATCNYDFLLIAGGIDAATGNAADRYCGNQLNPIGPNTLAAAPPGVPGVPLSVQVCTPIKPFKMTYHTDNTENEVTANGPTLPLNAIADTGNVGFCLDFQER